MLIDEILEGKRRVLNQTELKEETYFPALTNSRALALLPSVPRFDFSDIEMQFASDIRQSQKWVFADNAFAAIPPYPQTWCESSITEIGRIGCLFDALEFENAPLLPRFANRYINLDRISPSEIISRDETMCLLKKVYIVQFAVYFSFQSGVDDIISFAPGGYYFVNRDGLPLSQWYYANLLVEPPDGTDVEQDPHFITHQSLFFQYCFNLLACKNVEIVERSIDEKLQKARLRRGKKPLLSMYTLKINMPKTGAFKKEQRDPNNETVMKRFHAVRGHFAHYTEEKPLFGKYAGRFFVSAHTRGSKDLGEIRKDYKGVAK